MPSHIARAGDRALLVSFGSAVDAATLHATVAALRQRAGVLACIPGQQSVYVVFDHAPDPGEAEVAIEGAALETPRMHRLRVRFDPARDADLSEFLALHRLSLDDFLGRVSKLTLTARYLGFRAGFAYLDGWPQEWRMPRRPTSRPVPRGSFAIAGAVAGFYPIDTPGGWNLLGRTPAVLWDARREPPNLISAGDEIVIEPVTSAEEPPPVTEVAPQQEIEGISIVTNLPFTRVVTRADWSGVAHGLAPGGPFDEAAAAAANALVGNEPGDAVLECAMAGPRIRFDRRCAIAWIGAECDLPSGKALVVEGGSEISVGRIHDGLRGWLAVGSVTGSAEARPRGGDVLRERESEDRLRIRALAGPHELSARTIECEVTPQLDRVGIRLRPLQPLGISAPGDLPSLGMQCGTIQLHPDGSLVAMGPDHPVTGGYLQPMTLLWGERWKLARLAPGERVTFVCERSY